MQDAAARFLANRIAVAALAVALSIVVLSIVGPWINSNRADALDWLHTAARPGAPNAHWFGTDRLGRDLFVRTLQGTRVSLAVGLVASAVSVLIGVGYGAIAGYIGGRAISS